MNKKELINLLETEEDVKPTLKQLVKSKIQ